MLQEREKQLISQLEAAEKKNQQQVAQLMADLARERSKVSTLVSRLCSLSRV